MHSYAYPREWEGDISSAFTSDTLIVTPEPSEIHPLWSTMPLNVNHVVKKVVILLQVGS